MVQLKVLSGKMAGAQAVARRFPFCVGRAPGAHLRIEEAGIWDSHFVLECDRNRGFVLTAQGEARVYVNGQPATQAVLRNGDLIQIGSAGLHFWLAETRQRGLQWRERMVWSGLVFVTLGQLALLYWLL